MFLFIQITQQGTNDGTLVTNNTPQAEVRSLNENIGVTDNRTTTSDINNPIATVTNNIGNDSNLPTLTKENNIGQTDSENEPIQEGSLKSGRRKSRSILEHLMTRARFYKMIESKMNR